MSNIIKINVNNIQQFVDVSQDIMGPALIFNDLSYFWNKPTLNIQFPLTVFNEKTFNANWYISFKNMFSGSIDRSMNMFDTLTHANIV